MSPDVYACGRCVGSVLPAMDRSYPWHGAKPWLALVTVRSGLHVVGWYGRRCDAKMAVVLATLRLRVQYAPRLPYPYHEDHPRAAWCWDPYGPDRYSENRAVVVDMLRAKRCAIRRARHQGGSKAGKRRARELGVSSWRMPEPRIGVRNAKRRCNDLPF